MVLERKDDEDAKPRRYDNFLEFGRMKRKSVVDEESPYKQRFGARRVSLKDVVNRYRYGRRMAGKFYPEDWVSHIASNKHEKKRPSLQGRKPSKTDDAISGNQQTEGERPNEDTVETADSDADRIQLHVALPDAGEEADESDNGNEDEKASEERREKEDAETSSVREGGADVEESATDGRERELSAVNKADEKHDEGKEADQDHRGSQSTDVTAETDEDGDALIALMASKGQDESEKKGMKKTSLPATEEGVSETEAETRARRRRERGRGEKRKTKERQHRRTGDPYRTVPKVRKTGVECPALVHTAIND